MSSCAKRGRISSSRLHAPAISKVSLEKLLTHAQMNACMHARTNALGVGPGLAAGSGVAGSLREVQDAGEHPAAR